MTIPDLEFDVRYGQVDDQALLRIERKLGIVLPESYRRFLLQDGGGWLPRQRFFRVKWSTAYSGPQAEKPEWLALLGFHSAQDADSPDSLVGLWQQLRHQEPEDFGLPPEFISIASTAVFHVLLVIHGPHRGAIGVIQLNERPMNPDWTSIELVADDFERWAELLVDDSRVPPEYRDV